MGASTLLDAPSKYPAHNSRSSACAHWGIIEEGVSGRAGSDCKCMFQMSPSCVCSGDLTSQQYPGETRVHEAGKCSRLSCVHIRRKMRVIAAHRSIIPTCRTWLFMWLLIPLTSTCAPNMLIPHCLTIPPCPCAPSKKQKNQ